MYIYRIKIVVATVLTNGYFYPMGVIFIHAHAVRDFMVGFLFSYISMSSIFTLSLVSRNVFQM